MLCCEGILFSYQSTYVHTYICTLPITNMALQFTLRLTHSHFVLCAINHKRSPIFFCYYFRTVCLYELCYDVTELFSIAFLPSTAASRTFPMTSRVQSNRYATHACNNTQRDHDYDRRRQTATERT